MPDETSPVNEAHDEQADRLQSGQRDAVLESFVSIVDRLDVRFGVTLFVRGTVIAGEMIGAAPYLRAIGEDFAGALDRVGATIAAPSVRESFARWSEATARKAGANDPGEDDADDAPAGTTKPQAAKPQFVHLQNARVIGPSGVPEGAAMLWRGRLASVDGFVLGVPGPPA